MRTFATALVIFALSACAAAQQGPARQSDAQKKTAQLDKNARDICGYSPLLGRETCCSYADAARTARTDRLSSRAELSREQSSGDGEQHVCPEGADGMPTLGSSTGHVVAN